MRPGSVVVWLPDPWQLGHGTVKGVGKGGWLWVEWSRGPFDLCDPMTLELAEVWEHGQVEHDTQALT